MICYASYSLSFIDPANRVAALEGMVQGFEGRLKRKMSEAEEKGLGFEHDEEGNMTAGETGPRKATDEQANGQG